METKHVDLTALPFLGADVVKPVYANNAECLIAPWDIRIVFTEISGHGSGDELRKYLRAHIAMTPGHAKALIGALQQSVKKYEETFGEIKMPNVQPPPVKASKTPH